MTIASLFEPTQLGSLTLENRIVMAPLTRSRAVESNRPNALMAEYYGQRSGAGLIITEGTSPSPNGTGYARIPGIWSSEQIEGWREVARAVHAGSGRIFVQIMHTGRVGHPANLPAGGQVLAPSAVACEGEVFTDTEGLQPFPVPRAMSDAEVRQAIAELVQGAANAVQSGLDGVELHAANGYLLEQFLSPQTNRRTDDWGGSIEKRLRFVLEVANGVAAAIGAERVGIRLSPYGAGGGMKPYADIDAAYIELVERLIPIGLQYIHLVDHSTLGGPAVPESIKQALRKAWPRTVIVSGGFDRAKAEAALRERKGDLVAFGRLFISNPDLVVRLERGLPLAEADPATFYTPGAKGYTDYPTAG